MALVEDVTEDELESQSSSGPAPGTSAELSRTLKALSAKLALPEDLLPSFMEEEKPEAAFETYRDHAITTLRQINPLIHSPVWSQLSVEEQAEVVMDIVRLYGADDWTSREIRDIIDELFSSLETSSIAIHLLTNNIRALFQPTPHSRLNLSTSRALARPAGGQDASSDFHNTTAKTYKAPSAWGCHNVLAWCAAVLPPDEVERRIGLILPPTLILMDDWDPAWRAKGITVLSGWMTKLPAETMRRMGVDKLLLNSVLHTLSMHASGSPAGAVGVAIRMIEYTTDGKSRAERYAELMDKGIIQGWTYAPSGKEGRMALVGVARDLEELCGVLGVGIVRWLKAIIPNLLLPLQYPPTRAVLLHYAANLSALLCVAQAVRDTERIVRWRGQILDVLSRLWVQLGERGGEESDGSDDEVKRIRQLISGVFDEIAVQHPAVRENEYKELFKLDGDIFQSLVPSAA